MNKIEIFRDALDKFENNLFKDYCVDMINRMDDIYFTMPSSTTYKYHNATQCAFGGQTYHVLMVAEIMNYLLNLDYMKEKFPDSMQRDCLRIAAILHDSKKTNGGQYTVHEHPLLAGEWIKNTHVEHDIDDKFKAYIATLCASHSGQWTTNGRSNVILPSPTNDAEFLVHLCDYLGSRKNLDMVYTDYQKGLINGEQKTTDESPEKYIMPFGKYKGMTLGKIKELHPDYIEWAKQNMTKDPIKSILARI